MADYECKYRDQITEMSTDIKWLVKDAKERNSKFETHIEESDSFRLAVTRNVVWRHIYKMITVAIVATVAWIVKIHVKP